MRRTARVLASLLLCHLGAACSVPTIDVPILGDDAPPGPFVPPSCNDQDCAALGGSCHSGEGGRVCLLLDEPCDPTQASECLGNGVHACVAGFAKATAEKTCLGFEQCYLGTYAGSKSDPSDVSFAYCATSPGPCSANASSECRGNLLVICLGGFPGDEQQCDDKEHCQEYTTAAGLNAVCADNVTCPAELPPEGPSLGSPSLLACNDDTLVDCSSDKPYPSVVTDCTLFGEHCSTSGLTTCTVSASGPAAPEWRSVPAGSFTPNVGLIAGVPTDVAAFEMLRTEVTVGQYDQCVGAGACVGSLGCEPPTYRGDAPLECAAEPTAAQYCAWLGGRLPTAAEWEYAARNAGQTAMFPWGDDPATCSDIGWNDASVVGTGCDGQEAAGCQHGRDITAQGLCDLAGNLTEWVAPVDPSGASVRGQSYARVADPTFLGGSDGRYPSDGESDVGFRCVRPPP